MASAPVPTKPPVLTKYDDAPRWQDHVRQTFNHFAKSVTSTLVNIANGTTPVPPQGAVTGVDITGTLPAGLKLITKGPGAVGPIGDATHVAAVTTDVNGRVVALTAVPITFPVTTPTTEIASALRLQIGDTTLAWSAGHGFGILPVQEQAQGSFSAYTGDASRVMVKIASAAMLNSVAGQVVGMSGGDLPPDMLPVVQANARILQASTTHQRVWLAMLDNAAGPLNVWDAAAFAGMNYIGLRFDTGAGDTAWQVVSCDGATAAVTSTGVAFVPNVTLQWSLDFTKWPTSVAATISGTTTTVSTHLPSSGVGLSMNWSDTALSATAVAIAAGDWTLSRGI